MTLRYYLVALTKLIDVLEMHFIYIPGSLYEETIYQKLIFTANLIFLCLHVKYWLIHLKYEIIMLKSYSKQNKIAPPPPIISCLNIKLKFSLLCLLQFLSDLKLTV